MHPHLTRDRRKGPDRRLAVRVAQTGRVKLKVDGPVRSEVEGELIEASAQGFRLSHASRELVPGVVVEYAGAHGSGKARVVWTHVLAGSCVSGLMVL